MKASAPGKIILFGEHAVVYGRPALAVPVFQVQADVDVSDAPRPGIWIHAAAIGLDSELEALGPDHPLGAVILRLLSRSGPDSPSAISINISSSIPVASGLGSGAAVSVALTRALSSYLGVAMSDEQINDLVFDVEKIHHGTPSGIDNTVITYEAPVFFIKGQPIHNFHAAKPFTIVIADSGVSASTKESVAAVRELWTHDQAKYNAIFDQIGNISGAAREAIEAGHTDLLGAQMNQNHALLQELTVSSAELDMLVFAARDAGARGAKLSGGGRGGNMIALVDSEKAERLAQALLAAGARRTIVTQVRERRADYKTS